LTKDLKWLVWSFDSFKSFESFESIKERESFDKRFLVDGLVF
jgi:hypothetical protein